MCDGIIINCPVNLARSAFSKLCPERITAQRSSKLRCGNGIFRVFWTLLSQEGFARARKFAFVVE
jgi:hypothetical protein